MPRKPTIWRRGVNGFFYTTFRGKQVKLSQDRKEAEKAFHALHANAPDEGEDTCHRPTFRKLADLYLSFTEQAKSDLTYRHQRYFLQLFCDHVRTKRAADLKPGDLTTWCLRYKDRWGHNTQVTARGVVVACLNWAVEQGYLPFSPLARMKVGQMHGRERILTKEEREKVLAAARNKTFRRFLLFLEQTGCRPYSEAAQITAEMIEWEEGCVPLARHKNARKGKRRVIYLTDAAKSILQELCAERPLGPLFVTRYGVPYNKGNIIKTFHRLEKKLGIPRFNPYSYRHTFITEALERGLTADIVAELVGNTPKTIAKYYSHLESKKNTLREAARRAVGP
jgi:integrase